MDVTSVSNHSIETNTTSNISALDQNLNYQKQNLASLALQFMGTCIVGALGSIYTVKALKKVCSSSKILHKYIPIPNMLVAGLLICGLVLPLRIFTGIILLSGEDVYSLCLILLYAEQLCEAASLISALTLSLHRLRSVYRKAFSSFPDNTNQPSRIAVALSWLIPFVSLAVNTYLYTVQNTPPWILAICTNKFPAHSVIPSGVGLLLDFIYPVTVGAAFTMLCSVYSAIVCRMRTKTRSVHPSNTEAALTTHLPQKARKYSLSVQRQNGNKFPIKTVSWSSAATAASDAPVTKDTDLSEMTRHDNQTQYRATSVVNSHEQVNYRKSSVNSDSNASEDGCKEPPRTKRASVTSTYSIQEALRKTSILSLVQHVATIPEMRSEEDDAAMSSRKSSRSLGQRSRQGTFEKQKSNEKEIRADVKDMPSFQYPLQRRQLPPVKIPSSNRKKSARKKKKLHRKKGKPRAEDRDSITSHESVMTEVQFKGSDSSVNTRTKRKRLLRQTAVLDDDLDDDKNYYINDMMEQNRNFPGKVMKHDIFSNHSNAQALSKSRSCSSINIARSQHEKQLDDNEIPGLVHAHEYNKSAKNSNPDENQSNTEISDTGGIRRRSSQFKNKEQGPTLTSLDRLENEILEGRMSRCGSIHPDIISECSFRRLDDRSSNDEGRLYSDLAYKLSSSTAHFSSDRESNKSSMAESVGSTMDRFSQTEPAGQAYPHQPQQDVSPAHSENSLAVSVISDANSQSTQIPNQEQHSPKKENTTSINSFPSYVSNKTNSPKHGKEFPMFMRLKGNNAVHPLASTEGEVESQGDAPQIRIIRPSTDTLKHSINSPSRNAQLKLGAMKLRNWMPMTTIASTSESEYDVFGGVTDACSESARFSPISIEQRQSSSQSNYSNARWARRRSTLMSYRRSRYRMSSVFSRQFSLASIWSNIPRMRNRSVSDAPEVTGSFVLKRSLLIVGTFIITQFPLAIFHLCMYSLTPELLVNIYPILKLLQQTIYAMNPYIYVFSNQKIHKDLNKQREQNRDQ